MQNKMFPIKLGFSPEFKKNLANLAKKYRHIKSDLAPLLEDLQNGLTPGDRVPGTRYIIYKERIKNSDLGKGKSAGYRLIYQVQNYDTVNLIAIYAKSDQPDIRPHEIERIIRDII